MTIFLTLAVLVLAYVLAVFLVNRLRSTPEYEEIAPRLPDQPLPPLNTGEPYRVLTWNLGYAGMGREADFVMDGGKQYRPASLSLVERNLAAICSQIETMDADLCMFQEVALPSINTYGMDLKSAVTTTLSRYAHAYAPDIHARLIPAGMGLRIGNATYARARMEAAELRLLPGEPGYVAGFMRKDFRMHIARFPVSGTAAKLVTINIHLAAFDDAASVRNQQLQSVLSFAQEEYAQGNYVLVGGDWNLRLAGTEFPHRTAEEHLFWVHDLPEEVTPEGWDWVADPAVPTVRTAHQAYTAGDNYVCIIDGFLVSPNIRVVGVEAQDLGFANTDHHPVVMTFLLSPAN